MARSSEAMNDLEESWARTREHLTQARSKLPASPVPGEEGGSIAAFEEYLEHNELQLALSELELLETANRAPFSFWRHMQRAAGQMGLVEESARYEEQCVKLPLSPEWMVRLEIIASAHPLYREAKGLPYCAGPEMMLFDRDWIRTCRLPEDTKLLLNSLDREGEPVVCMAFWTALEKPEPLAGHGQMYAFFFDPGTLEIVSTDVSGWRS